MFDTAKTIGIDINEHIIRAVLLKKGKRKTYIKKYADISLAEGCVVNGRIVKVKAVQKAVKKLLSPSFMSHSTTVVVGLPESHAFIKTINIDPAKTTTIKQEIQKHIPFPIKEVTIDTITHNEEVLSFAAVKTEIAESYYSLLKPLGLHIRALEVESQAIARLCSQQLKDDTITILCDMGRNHTTFLVINDDHIDFTHTLYSISGKAVTKKISQELDIPIDQAEIQKIEHPDNQEIQKIIHEHVVGLANEINRVVDFHSDHSISTGATQYSLFLTGSGSQTQDISHYLEDITKYPIHKIELPKNIITPKQLIKEINSYSTAIGLAMRDYHPL